MRIFGWIWSMTFWLSIAAFLHYTLPQKDIVYIQGTEIFQINLGRINQVFYSGADSGDNTSLERDLRLINTTKPDGNVLVYRNEDTGLFGWPPYFKITSTDLQAAAQAAVSTPENPRWYLVTHYGWRFNAPTIYPNAISIREWPGPETQKPLPWVNIVILSALAFLYLALRTRWRRFRRSRLDPAFEEIQDNLEGTGDAFADRARRVRRWFQARRS